MIRDTGYGAELPAPDQTVEEELAAEEARYERELQRLRLKVVLTLGAAVVAMLLGAPLMLHGTPPHAADPLSRAMMAVNLLLVRALPPLGRLDPHLVRLGMLALVPPLVVWAGWRFFAAAWAALRHRAADMNTLIALGSIAALALSAVNTLASRALHAAQVIPETANSTVGSGGAGVAVSLIRPYPRPCIPPPQWRPSPARPSRRRAR